MAGLFSACTSEELIDNGGTEEGKDTSLSLVLTTGEPATKAAEGYQYATADEIKVSNCVVALFKMNGTTVGDMIGKVESFDFDASNTTYNNKPAYSLNNIPAKTGNVRILVIANATNADYTDFTTWSQFMEASTEKALVENDLVKVGWLDKELVAPVTGKIAVPLAQLSAKVKLDISTSDPSSWTYAISKITVEKINKKTDLILTSANSQKILEQLVLDNSNNAERFADLSFYTYENPLAESVKITIEGTLSEENGISETKKYSVELNKTVDNARLAEGLCHGTLYNIKGKIDVTTRTINFSWEILPWSTTVREVSVDIIKPKFLVVKDTEMTMPNTKTVSTTFNSSSKIRMVNVSIDNGTNAYKDEQYNITWNEEETSGTITVSTERIPQNFIPKYITFTIINEDDLTQIVKVVQYPPLYVEANTSTRKPTGSSSQNNDKLYQIKTLIADLTILSADINNDYELNESSFNHTGNLSDRRKTARSYVNELRNSGVCGFPLTEVDIFSGTTNVENSTKNFSNVSAKSTIEGAENNHRISPNFILASQNGINSISTNSNAKTNCALYYESIKNADGTTTLFGQGTWRMPTRSELMLIDVLQNTTKCEVKKILEGKGYLNALPEKLNMMDPRVSASTAVRCVRDIKE